MNLRVGSPVAGTTAALAQVPDPVFAGAMVGPGLAVWPETGPADAVAPVDGTIATLHPHAFVVAAEDGRAVLVHLGIDTVERRGDGFTVHVAPGESVRAGQPVIGWHPEAMREAGHSPVVPVIALDATERALTVPAAGTTVGAGQELFVWSG